MGVNLYLEITNACIHQCITCPHGTGNPNKAHYFMPLDEMKATIDDAILRRDITSVTISGGEPLMHPDIARILQMLSERFNAITILTNLHFFEEKNIASIVKPFSEKISFVTALHSATSTRHDMLTGFPGSFNRVISGLDSLFANNINTVIKVILCKDTCAELLSIFQMCTERWGHHPNFDLCGMDLCGADYKTIKSIPIDFTVEGKYINAVLENAEAYYKGDLIRKVMITEYPLCNIDPYFWRLAKRSVGDRVLTFVSKGEIDTRDSLKDISHCYPCAQSCESCAVKTGCPGLWPSILTLYGESMLKPVHASSK